MNTKIKQWLNDSEKTFDEGLAIYDKVKKDTKKDAFFRTQPTFKQGSIQFNMLSQELIRISRIMDQQQPQVKAPVISIKQENPTIKANPAINKKNVTRAGKLVITDVDLEMKYEDLPAEMKAKYDEIRSLSKELGGLKLMLETVPTNEERQQVADQLCTSYDKRRDLWMELDAWKQTDVSESAKKELTVDEIKKQIKLKKDNINRAMKNKEPKNKAKNEKSIKKWANEIEDLEKLLPEQA